MRPLTIDEQAMLDNARPSERVVIRDLFELLDARLVTEGALRGSSGAVGTPTTSPVLAAPSVTEPLFQLRQEDAA